jgi:S-DNA-T family DNA segregation ATPase FtsK/SpoIIIE
MNELWVIRQRRAWLDFLAAVEKRAASEAEVRTGYTQRDLEIDQAYQDGLAQFEVDSKQAVIDLEQKRVDTLEALRGKYAAALDKANGDYQGMKQQAHDDYASARGGLEAEFKETRWTIGTIKEADDRNSKDQLSQQQQDAGNQVGRIESQRKEAIETLRTWKLEVDDKAPTPNKPKFPDPWKDLQAHVDDSKATHEAMKNYGLPKHIIGSRPFLYMIIAWVLLSGAAAGALFVLEKKELIVWLVAMLVVPAVVFPAGIVIRQMLLGKMEEKAEELWLKMEQSLADAKVAKQNAIETAKKEWGLRGKQIKATYDKSVAELTARINATQDEYRKQRDATIVAAQKKYEPFLKKIEQERELKLQQGEQYFVKQLVDLKKSLENKRKALDDHKITGKKQNEERYHAEWNELYSSWTAAWEGFQGEMNDIESNFRHFFRTDWAITEETHKLPLGLPFGYIPLTDEMIPNLIPEDENLVRPEIDKIFMPALLAFPERSSLLLQTPEEGRSLGVKTLEGILQRIWMGLPPGRARCTIIDPVGRGENFAASMHLADADPNLVTSKVWTEIQQIEQVLTDLTGTMETILQKFLRNQYSTLADYNEQADEVAEPFRFLVIANFPVNFSPDAAQRVISLATSGARCGIYTFILVDSRYPMPHGIKLEDLEKACTTLVYEDGTYVWQDDVFGKYPLTLEQPSAEELATQLYQEVGKKTVKALRVEVPFMSITPKEPDWWLEDSSGGIDVPIGKAGARRLQHMTLGKGTSQHVLVAGKTGSGKSTLLHVLIMQLCVRYSPDQVQLYLIDFKKGVEFKTYATSRLPHCKVVAIESEREFGLSVLQRIDVELTQRGDLFRRVGVNDLPSYRKYLTKITPEERDALPPVPRQLLLIDEFQEFFTEDDKVSQEAGLLMDRIVRQGRSFGIHLMMGSQTIGGAFSLARTTIDQMAVRIALQCSEADAHLILSRENSDARLLNRPGEAIYNNQNGMPEGNNFFQIVYISDDQRDDLLKKIHKTVAERHWKPRDPMIVFEGNLAADAKKNKFLLPGPRVGKFEPNAFKAFLGDAVAIKDPTCAIFRRQSGSNLMMVGQSEEAAFNIQTTAALSLFKDHPECQVYFSSGPQLELPQEEVLAALQEIAPFKVLEPRELNETIKQLGKEVDLRLKNEGSKQPTFLMLYGLQRIRDLRKPDDDFGFGKKGEEEKPYQTFAKLIREGPPVGIFIMFWCDNLTNMQRYLERATMREFEMRILFQMNANDSSALMDSPVAARLGAKRAFFYTEDQGKTEKFRPYGLLDSVWLREFKGEGETEQAAAKTNHAAAVNANGNGQEDGNGDARPKELKAEPTADV